VNTIILVRATSQEIMKLTSGTDPTISFSAYAIGCKKQGKNVIAHR
jgi:hypothetical protein